MKVDVQRDPSAIPKVAEIYSGDRRSLRHDAGLAEQRPHAPGCQDRCSDVEPPREGIGQGIDDHRRRWPRGGLADPAHAERVVVGGEVEVLHEERRHLVGAGNGIVHQRARQELAVVAVDDVLAERDPETLGEAADGLPVDDHRVDLAAAVVHDDVAENGETPRLDVDLHDRRVDAARPGHRGQRIELRGPEARPTKLDEASIAEGSPRQVAQRDRARRRSDHEGLPALEADIGRGAFEQACGHPARRGLHRGRRVGHGVPRVDRDATGAGPVAVGHERGVAPAHVDVLEPGPEVLRADLGEHGLVALARAGDADEHGNPSVLVDLHRGPFAGIHAAARL